MHGCSSRLSTNAFLRPRGTLIFEASSLHSLRLVAPATPTIVDASVRQEVKSSKKSLGKSLSGKFNVNACTKDSNKKLSLLTSKPDFGGWNAGWVVAFFFCPSPGNWCDQSLLHIRCDFSPCVGGKPWQDQCGSPTRGQQSSPPPSGRRFTCRRYHRSHLGQLRT